ncbi:MAG: hypothetical protein HUU41_12515 [Bryobacteraceae bacterium]|nr:hypothetical protein [Bryobacterales bacterium]NUN01931.1 hypothetical protein [Bryobacteraceae bacterium]
MRRREFIERFWLPPLAIGWPAAGRSETWQTRVLGKIAFELPPGPYSAVTRSADGHLYWLAPRRLEVIHIDGSTGETKTLNLTDVPETASTQCDLMAGIQADANGDIFLPAIWRQQTRAWSFGVFVVNRAKGYRRTIVLSPAAEIRHIALEPVRHLFVLGMDAAYFRQQTDACMLVHKYDLEGQRLIKFSECPGGLALRRPGDVRPGVDFNKLKREVDRSDLWYRQNQVFHVLPGFRRLRSFHASTGTPIAEIEFIPPASLGEAGIRKIVPVAGGGYLVLWVASEVSPGMERNSQLLSMHDASGKSLSVKPLSRTEGAPLSTDDSGNIYLLQSPSPNRFELAKAAIGNF